MPISYNRWHDYRNFFFVLLFYRSVLSNAYRVLTQKPFFSRDVPSFLLSIAPAQPMVVLLLLIQLFVLYGFSVRSLFCFVLQ